MTRRTIDPKPAQPASSKYGHFLALMPVSWLQTGCPKTNEWQRLVFTFTYVQHDIMHSCSLWHSGTMWNWLKAPDWKQGLWTQALGRTEAACCWQPCMCSETQHSSQRAGQKHHSLTVTKSAGVTLTLNQSSESKLTWLNLSHIST